MKVCETGWIKLSSEHAPCLDGMMDVLNNGEKSSDWEGGRIQIKVYNRRAKDRFRMTLMVCDCSHSCQVVVVRTDGGIDWDWDMLPPPLRRFAKTLNIKGKKRRVFYVEIWFRR